MFLRDVVSYLYDIVSVWETAKHWFTVLPASVLSQQPNSSVVLLHLDKLLFHLAGKSYHIFQHM